MIRPDQKREERIDTLVEHWVKLDAAQDILDTTPYRNDLEPQIQAIEQIKEDIEEEVQILDPQLDLSDLNVSAAVKYNGEDLDHE